MKPSFFVVCMLGTAVVPIQSKGSMIGYGAYTLEINWLDSSDQHFMDQVHLRSDQWISRNYATVYSYRETLFGHTLSYEEQVELDSMSVLWDASWTLCILANSTMDTLVIAGMSRNVKPTIDLWKDLYGDRSWVMSPFRPEPLYIIPISYYSDFLTLDERSRLDDLIDKTMENIPTLNYTENNVQVHSLEWLWMDHPEWKIFDNKLAAHTPSKCFDRHFMSWPIITNIPDGSSQLSPWEVHRAGLAFDTLHTSDGVTSIIEWSRTLEAIEITIQAQRLDKEMKWYELNDLIPYQVKPEYIGLRFEEEQHPHLWMGLNSFVDCYGNILLDGWCKAVIANEIYKQLKDHRAQ